MWRLYYSVGPFIIIIIIIKNVKIRVTLSWLTLQGHFTELLKSPMKWSAAGEWSQCHASVSSNSHVFKRLRKERSDGASLTAGASDNSDKNSKVFFVLIFAVFYQILYFLYHSGTVIQVSSKLWMFLICTPHKTRTFTVRLAVTTKSHTRTVVRECCKGDEASQWRKPKFDPRHAHTP